MKRPCFKSLLSLLFILLVAGLSSCHKDNEPEIKPDLDPQLVGTWKSEIKLDEASLLVEITFNGDGTFKVIADGRLSLKEEEKQVNASGTYTAKEGTLKVTITESALPELVGKTFQDRYKILVGQLYFEDLFLFPFDKVD